MTHGRHQPRSGCFYACGFPQAAEVAATLNTLVETAKLHNVDPTRYLTEAVRAADRGEALFPWQLPPIS